MFLLLNALFICKNTSTRACLQNRCILVFHLPSLCFQLHFRCAELTDIISHTPQLPWGTLSSSAPPYDVPWLVPFLSDPIPLFHLDTHAHIFKIFFSQYILPTFIYVHIYT